MAAVLSSSIASAAPAQRRLYAVNEAAADRGTVSLYDIDAGHRLLKTIRTVPNIADVRGVAASGSTGNIYVAYRDRAGAGKLYCLNVYTEAILWDRAIRPSVDRLAVNPNGRMLYVPTGEDGTADFINVADARSGDVVRTVHLPRRSHDALYPLAGPLFQETKARDGGGAYLYRIDPQSNAISRIGPYSGILGPYAVDSKSRLVVNDVTGLWGMQVADLATGRIVTAPLPQHPAGNAGLMHGIGWSPDESEVWQSSSGRDPHVYVWSMADPMAPALKKTLTLRSGHGSHWLTFSIKGDHAYIAPEKNSGDGTEIFDARTHSYVKTIASSEDMLEIDFVDGKISAVGDQYGIGRR